MKIQETNIRDKLHVIDGKKMVKTVAFDRVDLSAKSMLWLSAAFAFVIIAWGIGNWGAGKVKGLTKQATPIDEFA